MLIHTDDLHGAIIRQYFDPIKPHHARKSKELEALATIACLPLSLKAIYVVNVWIPANKATVAFYSAAQLQEIYQRLCDDLSCFQP